MQAELSGNARKHEIGICSRDMKYVICGDYAAKRVTEEVNAKNPQTRTPPQDRGAEDHRPEISRADRSSSISHA